MMQTYGRVRIYRQGDKCPFCGQPIKTDDPFTLGVLTAMAALLPEETHEENGQGAGEDR